MESKTFICNRCTLPCVLTVDHLAINPYRCPFDSDIPEKMKWKKTRAKSAYNKRLPGSQPKRKNKSGIVPAVRPKSKSAQSVSNGFRFGIGAF